MAMPGFDKEAFTAPMAEINTTPLVDVMLVLMVIFLVTAPMLTQAVQLELPKETASQIIDENPIKIAINAQGEFFWGDEIVTEERLKTYLEEAAAKDSTQPIHLRADSNALYGKVSKVLAMAQKSGLNNLGFVTEPN